MSTLSDPVMPARPPVRLLLVDDDESYAGYVRVLLARARRAPYEITAVTTAAAGLRQLATGEYDACLLDYRLAGEDGLTVLRTAVSRGIRVPIILLTGHGDSSLEMSALEEGASDYLPKADVETARLEQAIAHAIARHRADAALRLRESRLAEAEAFALVMVVHVAHTGRFLRVPPQLCALLDYSEEELLALRFQDVTHPDDVAADDALRERLLRGDVRSIEIEKRYVRKDGGVRWVYINSSVVSETPTSPGYFLTYVRDVSARKRLEDELRQAQKMEAVGQLAGGVAHDFNNLLTAILGYAEMLELHVGDDAQAVAALTEIQRAGSSAAGLTRQLLAFSRKQVLKPEVLGLDTIVTQTVSLLTRVIGAHIDIQTVLAPGSPLVKADRVQLQQVLLNLAVNARDAMPSGGRLTISTGAVEIAASRPDMTLEPGPYATMVVEDTGCGMDAATAARIFEPFFTTKQSDRGTGLGLSTVYGIVTQSGGYITCRTAPGEGATFTIYLPASAAPRDVAAARQPALSGRH